MGKSVVAGVLADLGARVVDTDLLARKLVDPGQPALAEIREVLGERFLDEQGALRRSELGQHVFADAEARARLERILHPRIRTAWRTEVARWRHLGEAVGVVVIPLLFETHAEGDFDEVICVACSDGTQRSRLAERGWSDEEAQRRIAAQLDIAEKMGRSDRVIWTEGDLSATREQAKLMWRCFGGSQ